MLAISALETPLSDFLDSFSTTLVNKPRVQGARSAAHRLLETTGHPVERIAGEVGFGSPTSFRDLFKSLVGTSPRDYRRAFRGSPAR